MENFDVEKAKQIAENLGIDIEFNSDTPGVHLADGTVISIKELFADFFEGEGK